MFTHPDIWRAIDRLALTFGYSTSGLAKKAGLDPTAFNKSKRTSPDGKPRWPSTESIAKILAVTGASMSDFLALLNNEAENGHPAAAAHRKIPILGCAQAGAEGYFDDAGYPVGNGWDEVQIPEFDSEPGNNIYALEISGDSMQPLYREGDVLIISPEARLRRGDRVVVRTTGGEVMAKELIRQTASKVDLRSLNTDHGERSLPLQDVTWIARVLWVSQ